MSGAAASASAPAHHTEAVYWDPVALRDETQRVLDICHGCRRCWNLCPSFGNLFKRLDALEDAAAPAGGGAAAETAAASSGPKPEGEHAAAPDPSLAFAANPVDALADADRDRVVDECYQCKLCFNHCPYHPPHRYQLDFPRLMQRAKAVRAREKGIPLADRVFAQVDLLGWVSSLFAPLVNWANAQAWLRRGLEFGLGVHRLRNLPLFHSETFRAWWDWRGPRVGSRPSRKGSRVALFYTCTVNYNEPDTGRDAVAVLERNGYEVLCPTQRCCGMPQLDCGDLSAALAAARRNVAALYPLARAGVPILALGPTCSYMLKEEYPVLLRTEEARVVASRAMDVMEFLAALKREGRLDRGFVSGPGRVAYHLPCHLKAQNMGFRSKEVLEALPGAAVTLVDRCSAHDGTWGMKKDYYELSMRTGGKLFIGIEEAAPDAVATDCPLAALQIVQGAGRPASHPIRFVAQAYGLGTDPS